MNTISTRAAAVRPMSCRGRELTDAFTLLRHAPSGTRTHAIAWRAIDGYVRSCFPRDRDEDVRQEVLLTVALHLGREHGAEIRNAGAWLHVIHRSKRIDEYRAARRVRAESIADAVGVRELGLTPTVPRELAELVVAAFLERVEAFLADTVAHVHIRALRRAQCLAALRRVGLGDTLPDIAEHLALDGSMDLVAKWIERGRAVIVGTVEHDRTNDRDLADFFEPLAELARERRSDAGLPRPGRRKPLA